MDNNISAQDSANQMAYDFFKYHINKSGLNIDGNITNYAADVYGDTLYPSDTNSSEQSYVPNFESKSIADSLINYVIDNADDPMNSNLPPEWKEASKQQFSDDMNKFIDYMANNFNNFIDWLNENQDSNQALPSFNDFLDFNPNDPNNLNPNDGNNLNPDSDGDGIPDSIDPYPNDASPDADGDGIPDNIDQYPNDPNNGEGHQTPYDPTTPGMSDPLVLDSDKDGFISTISLDDSSAYFDLTGDGVKEKVGWISPNDGLLVYDKDDNGNISGIDEVFGSGKVSGFTELRELADSNYDGVIDRKDELYNRLKIWQDKNQDGISQTDELVGLKEAGVKSIDLDAVTTNIDVNGNVITEASHYTDDENNLELAADLELEFDSRITNIDTSTIPDYTEHPESNTLPFLRGYGVVHDSNVAYNLDDNFRALALELASDVTKTANDFQEYMDGWSGYTKMQTDLQEKYGLSDTPKLSDLDRKVWTYEHFMGTGTFSAGIEGRLEATAAAMVSGGSDTAASGRYNGAVVNSVYGDFTNRNKAFFSLKAFYPDVLSDAQYQRGVDEYVITDQDALNAKVSSYINNPDNSLEEKLYLVSQMNVLEGTFLDFNADAITSNIDDTLVKNLVTSIYNDTLNADIYNNDGIYSNNSLIVGNYTDETIDANVATATVLAGKGDGADTLNFSDISHENVIIKSDGNDANHDVRIKLSNMPHKYTYLLYKNFFKQNAHIFITKQDNINNYLKILDNFNKREVA